MHATPIHLPRAITSIHSVTRSPFHKGTASKTHRDDKDFTTKASSHVYDEDHHFQRRAERPYGEQRLRPSKFAALHNKNTRPFSHMPTSSYGAEVKTTNDIKKTKPKPKAKASTTKTSPNATKKKPPPRTKAKKQKKKSLLQTIREDKVLQELI
jgi:hypothetical protein